MNEMQVHVRKEGERAWVTLHGELDLGSATEVERHLADLEQKGLPVMILDLRELTFIDSTGLRSVLAADARARREGRRLIVIPGPPPVHRVFRIALLDQRLEFVDDPESVSAQEAGDGGD